MYEQSQSFNTFLQESLNPQQQEIVTRAQGVMVIHAGAGSGKTRVITARIASLVLHHNAHASSILALTFTNKAAREMKERVLHFLGPGAQTPFVGTFHSYCLTLLKRAPDLCELPNFTILDPDDGEKLLKTILARYAVTKKITPSHLLGILSRIKNNATTGVIDLSEIDEPIFQEILHKYEQEKTASRCLDFDDLLLHALRLFKKNPHFKAAHQARIRHILVDEYQDTNGVQNALLKEMSLGENKACAIDSLCIVGDEDQSIYSWRGAIAGTMIIFKHDFDSVQTVSLEQNYRSVQSILDIANTVISNNTLRNPKRLWSMRNGTDRIRVLTCNSGYQEAEIIADFCRLHMRNELNNIAILYRSHYQSRTLEEALVRSSIPYTIIGGIQFYDRQEIKDLLAYLKLSVNRFDRVAFTRIINSPSRGLGDKFLEHFFELWNMHETLDFAAVAQIMIQERNLTATKRLALSHFVSLFSSLPEKASDVLEHFIVGTKFATYLKDSYDPQEAVERQDNVKELVHALRAMEERDQVTVASFLEGIALLQEHTKDAEKKECVRMMTLHAAKGLEFDTVIITGLEDGILPTSRSIITPDALEEERRLFYVGITRAQERLLITHARYRYTYGQMTDQLPSRFLHELGDNPIKRDDVSYWNAQEAQRYLKQWLNGSQDSPSPTMHAIQRTAAPAAQRTTQPVMNMRVTQAGGA